MKLTSVLLSIFLFYSGAILAADDSVVQNPSATDIQHEQMCQELKDSDASEEVIAKRGCCSWHKGVCGCSSGRITCCDGSYSPSCTCNQEDTVTDHLKL